MRPRLPTLLGGLASLSIVACAAFTSSSPSTSGGGETDGSASEAAPCVPGAKEDCTNGVDDNCDGLVDCADPTCAAAGFACVPAVPTGFAYATIDTTDSATCPNGTTASEIIASASGDPASCSCNCAIATLPSCTHGSITAEVGASNGCGDGTLSFTTDGACHTVTSIASPFLMSQAPLPVGGSCSGAVTKNVDTVKQTSWRACGYAGPFGGGCTTGNVCAVAAPSLKACVTVPGSVACPSGYPAGQMTGTSVTDTRGCGACTCNAPTDASCSAPVLTLYNDTACTNAFSMFTLDGSCNMDNGGQYNSYKYTATASAQCGAGAIAQPTPTGGVTLGGATTTCCAP